jgi:hypothetical protein
LFTLHHPKLRSGSKAAPLRLIFKRLMCWIRNRDTQAFPPRRMCRAAEAIQYRATVRRSPFTVNPPKV